MESLTRRWTVLFLLAMAVFAVVMAPAAGTAVASDWMGEGETAVSLTQSDAHGLQFVLRTPPVTVGADGVVTAPGLTGETSRPGAPALPFYATLIALPPGATITVDVVANLPASERVTAVRPAPQGIHPGSDSPLLSVRELEVAYEPDPAVYNADALYPDDWYSLSEPMTYRDLRVVQLRLFPIRYNPARQQLQRAPELRVNATFHGGQLAGRQPIPAANPSHATALANLVLNYEQGRQWHSRPAAPEGTAVTLPVGVDTYKIEVNADGLYELSYAALQAAGMDVTNVDPTTFQMMYRGQSVAYEFVGDPNDGFDPGEAVRFYGWAFDGSRLEAQYLTSNIFWLWAGGTPSAVSSVANNTGGPVVASFPARVVNDPVYTWFPTWTNRWPSFENEPDAWYWTNMTVQNGNTLTYGFPVSLVDPDPGAGNATFTVEILSRSDAAVVRNHTVHVFFQPNYSYTTSRSWSGANSVNIAVNAPANLLVQGDNWVDVQLASPTPSGGVNLDRIYINQVAADYWRLTKAVSDTLQLRDNGGPRTFEVTNFSSGDLADAIVWNITDRHNPVKVSLGAGDIVGSGPYTYRFGSSEVAPQAYVAAVTGAVKSPVSVSQYVPADLTPSGGGADWVAVAYGAFMGEVTPLATHRQNPQFGGLATHVVNVQDVINQYGYGLPLPSAINDYMLAGLTTWTPAPSYLILVGDATINPRQHYCLFGCGGNGMNTDTQYVPTHILFTDRFQGEIPSDATFTFLVGDDHLPEMAVSRLPAKSAADVANMVAKIIEYETNQLTPAGWMTNMLFISDDTDTGGNFCAENAATTAYIATSFNNLQYCLPDNSQASTSALRTKMYDTINITGTLTLNYRGHGSITAWASPALTTSNDGALWNNAGRPIIILSADCLDGYFAFPNAPGLGEAFFKLNGKGTAAHWSSAGLGYSFEHSVLHEEFYDGLFQFAATNIGDAVNYSKTRYVILRDTTPFSGDLSEVEAFTLLGDAAMIMMRPELGIVMTASRTQADFNDPVDFTLDLANNGLYPSTVTVTNTLPAGLAYEGSTASVPVTESVIGNQVVYTLTNPMALGATAVITVSTRVNVTNGELTNRATIGGTGLDADTSNQSAQVVVSVGTPTAVASLTASANTPAPLAFPASFGVAALLLAAATLVSWRRRPRKSH